MVFAAARPAHADWHLTPFIGVTIGGATTFPDPENTETERKFARAHRVFGGTVTQIGRRPLGFEGIVAYVPGIFDRGESLENPVLSSRTLALMGNVMFTTPRAWNEYGLRPFASGGFGLLHVAQRQELDALSFRRNVLGYNVGGGVTGFFSDTRGVRFEVRRFAYVKPGETLGFSVDDENLSYWETSVGFVIRLRRR